MSLDTVTPSGASSLPGRVDPNTIVVPSHDNEARVSLAAELTGASRWMGAFHPDPSVGRVAVQMSGPPSVPGRVESNTTSRPSCRTFGRVSSAAVFNPGTSCAGPQSNDA